MEEAKNQDTRERELLKEYVTARTDKEQFEAKASAAGKEMETAKNKLVEYLEDMGKKSTGKYDDLGSLLIKEPIATFKVQEDHKDEIPDWVKSIGAEKVIKETINFQTLQSLFRERIDKSESIPDFVEIRYVPQVAYNKPTA